MQTAPINEHPSSPLVRLALLAYTFLIVYASLFPFSGWHRSGVSPLAYLSEPWPHYWTAFDVSIDIVGYMPLGVLLVLACYPWIPRWWAALLSFLLGTLLSGAMEATQTFLPSRVASRLDLATNSLGVLIGVLIGAVLTPMLLERDMLRQIRQRWVVPDVSNGLILIALWPFAQIFPQGYLFGLGQVVPTISHWFDEYLDISFDLGDLLRHGAELTTEQYWLAETIITCCGLAGAVLILLCLLRVAAPRARLIVLLTGVTLAIKTLALALLFSPENAWSWMTPGAQAGLIMASLMLYGLTHVPPRTQRRLAMLMLTLSLVVTNVVPGNPYFTDTMSGWVQGKFLNFNGAAEFLSETWPLMALWFLLHYRPQQRN